MPSAPMLWLRMDARSIDEPHRASSELELLFDLTFVVAVGALTGQFEHSVARGHAGGSVLPFLQVFFAIWWAWMNFTWFASSYGIDDVVYRLLTMVQMGGVLVLAAGIPAAIDASDYRAVSLGYLVMRLGLAALWVRAGIENLHGRRTALRYACAISALQLAWSTRYVVFAHTRLPAGVDLVIFAGLAALELSVPRWAERTGPTTWHPHHIAERYGLFTIILLGDDVLATSTGLRNALATAQLSGPVIGVAAAGFALLCALWWLYFLEPAGDGLAARRHRSYLWGYSHFGVFAALAALGSGLRIAIEETARPRGLSLVTTGYAVAVPSAVFILLLWAVHRPIVDKPVLGLCAILAGVGATLAAPLVANQAGLPIVVGAMATVSMSLVVSTFRRPFRPDSNPSDGNDSLPAPRTLSTPPSSVPGR
jgi:low temperature requirement protein LtrA